MDQFARDPHLATRGFWVPVEHPDLGVQIPYPRAPYHFDRAGWAIRRRAPRIDDDGDAILAELTGPATGPERSGRRTDRPYRPAHLPECPFRLRYPSPKLGENSRETLNDLLGFSPAEIDLFLSEGPSQG